MIQMLTYDENLEDFGGEHIVIHTFHDAQSLDEFDVNIINLSDPEIWRNDGNETTNIKIIKDINSVSIMINNNTNTELLIFFPQNIIYRYYCHNTAYLHSCELKDMLGNFYHILGHLHVSLGFIQLIYENTKTVISGERVDAAFSFAAPEDKVLLRSEKSQKPTVVKWCDNMILSTLDIRNYEDIMRLLTELKLIQNKQSIPSWMNEIQMFDDVVQSKVIEDNNNVIKIANEKISEAKAIIDKNNEYKSILYTTGNELVKVVFEILETMIGCDLSQFEDLNNEDFLFEVGGFVFIGEIKGVNHNVKNENVSQLDVHYHRYLDENEETKEEQIKALLVINHQRNKPTNTREPIHEQQIKLACRNGSLIIETTTLLKIFERYLSGDLTRDNCLELLTSKVGLLTI